MFHIIHANALCRIPEEVKYAQIYLHTNIAHTYRCTCIHICMNEWNADGKKVFVINIVKVLYIICMHICKYAD